MPRLRASQTNERETGDAMHFDLKSFWHNENGAITVDWTALGAAVVGLSLATAAALTGTLDMVISRVDHELRSQQLSDDFVQYTPSHFEQLLSQAAVDTETAQSLFAIANGMMNQDIINALAQGLEKMANGTLSKDDQAMLYAIASVAYQRNIVDDHILKAHFGF